jgi:hypothetical protein
LHFRHLGLLAPEFVASVAQTLLDRLASFTLGSQPLLQVGNLLLEYGNFSFVRHNGIK